MEPNGHFREAAKTLDQAVAHRAEIAIVPRLASLLTGASRLMPWPARWLQGGNKPQGVPMTLYENVFIVRQDVSSQQVEDLAARFSGIVTEGGGRITKVEHWGLRTLAYKIKKNRKGHYVLMNVDAPPDAVKEMERNMRLSEDVLRLMTIRVDELEEGPSAMMRNRGSRDERGRGGDRPRRDSRGGEGRDRPAASAPADAAPAASAPAVSAPADAAPGAESAPEKAEAPPAEAEVAATTSSDGEAT